MGEGVPAPRWTPGEVLPPAKNATAPIGCEDGDSSDGVLGPTTGLGGASLSAACISGEEFPDIGEEGVGELPPGVGLHASPSAVDGESVVIAIPRPINDTGTDPCEVRRAA